MSELNSLSLPHFEVVKLPDIKKNRGTLNAYKKFDE